MPVLRRGTSSGSQRWEKGDEQVGRENTFGAGQRSIATMVRMFGALCLGIVEVGNYGE